MIGSLKNLFYAEIKMIDSSVIMGRRAGVVVSKRTLHQRGSTSGVSAMYGLSFLLLYMAPRGFFLGTLVFNSHKKQHLI